MGMMAQVGERKTESKHYEVSNDSTATPKASACEPREGKGCGTEGESYSFKFKNFENLCQLYFNKAEIVKNNNNNIY